MDYVRRDLGDGPFQDRFRDLFRVAYGLDYKNFSILFGGAYADFETLASEYRVLQQGIYKIKPSLIDAFGIFRMGLEQRKFDEDDHWYWRARAKILLTLLNSKTVAPVVYNESFWGFQGQDRFKDGFNENRLGLGLRLFWQEVEAYIFLINIKSLNINGSQNTSKWLQVQVNFDF